MERDTLAFIEVEKNIIYNLRNVVMIQALTDVEDYNYTLQALAEHDDRFVKFNVAKYNLFFPHNPLLQAIINEEESKIQKFSSDFLKRIVTYPKSYISQDDIDDLFLDMLEELADREFYNEVYKKISKKF